jgi:tetratricopeptide (TPR) repeat protein
MKKLYKEKANIKYKEHNFDEAILLYTKGIEESLFEEDPIDHILYRNRALCYFNKKEFQKCSDDSLKSIDISPNWSKGYITTGLAFEKMGYLAHAKKIYEIGMEKAKDGELEELLNKIDQKIENIKGSGKKLTSEEANTFYSIFLPILHFTSQKFKLFEYENLEEFKKSSFQEKQLCSEAFWNDSDNFENYLSQTNQNEEIIRSWKNNINSTFIICKHTTNGSIFIDTITEKVYIVNGIADNLENICNKMQENLPIVVKTVLIPWKNKIIYDGFLTVKKSITLDSFGFDYKDILKNSKHLYKL